MILFIPIRSIDINISKYGDILILQLVFSIINFFMPLFITIMWWNTFTGWLLVSLSFFINLSIFIVIVLSVKKEKNEANKPEQTGVSDD